MNISSTATASSIRRMQDRHTVKQRLQKILTIGALLTLTTQAFAQMGGGMGGGMGGSGGMGGGMGGGNHRPNRPPEGANPCPTPGTSANLADDVALQIDKVETQLKLTPAQAPLWANYRDQVFALVSDQVRAPRINPANQGSAKQQIERKLDKARNQLTALEDIANAANRLYAGLDATQQRLADELLATTVPTMQSGARPNDRPERMNRPPPQ